MIPKKYEGYVFSFFMALIMSCIMSLVICIINVGFSDGIVGIWLRAWGIAFVVAYPIVMLVNPVARRLVGLIVDRND